MNPDSNHHLEVEETVIEEIRRRRDVGREKYGTSMERDDLTVEQWVVHAKEEALDFAIYLEKLGRGIGGREARNARLIAALQEVDEVFSKFGPDEDSSYGMVWANVKATLADAVGTR